MSVQIIIICLLLLGVCWTCLCVSNICKRYRGKPLTLREMQKYHHTIISSETAEELMSQSVVLTVDVLNETGRIVRLGLIDGNAITFKVKDY